VLEGVGFILVSRLRLTSPAFPLRAKKFFLQKFPLIPAEHMSHSNTTKGLGIK
jgi:hypothetical protein